MLRNKILIMSVITLLSACATTEPAIKTVVQRVEVPVAVPCRTAVPAAPALSFENLSQDQTLYTKVQVMLSDRELQIAYETELLAALNSCIK